MRWGFTALLAALAWLYSAKGRYEPPTLTQRTMRFAKPKYASRWVRSAPLRPFIPRHSRD